MFKKKDLRKIYDINPSGTIRTAGVVCHPCAETLEAERNAKMGKMSTVTHSAAEAAVMDAEKG